MVAHTGTCMPISILLFFRSFSLASVDKASSCLKHKEQIADMLQVVALATFPVFKSSARPSCQSLRMSHTDAPLNRKAQFYPAHLAGV
eukprot:scaffold762_cov363-Pavlova_lutheri.AAC.64